MGARYVRAALIVEANKLTPAPRLVLVAMAVRVLDAKHGDVERGLYYGGRHKLLGDLATLPTRTTLRHLTGHISTLVELGLIERLNRPTNGEQAIYRLRLPVEKLPR